MYNHIKNKNRTEGIVLVGVMMILTVLSALAGAYMMLAKTDLRVVHNIVEDKINYNNSESGIHLRMLDLQGAFFTSEDGKPTGSSPSSGVLGCLGNDRGSGSLGCINYDIGNNNSVETVVFHDEASPSMISLPPTGPLQGLTSENNKYHVFSYVKGNDNQAVKPLKSVKEFDRIFLFQFLHYTERDAKILHSEFMNVEGPIFGRGAVFIESVESGRDTYISGPIYSDGYVEKGDDYAYSRAYFLDPTTDELFFRTSGGNYVPLGEQIGDVDKRYALDLTEWAPNITQGDGYSRDSRYEIAPTDGYESITTGGTLWKQANLRIVLKLDADGNPDTTVSPTGVIALDPSGNIDTSVTSILNNPNGSCLASDNLFPLDATNPLPTTSVASTYALAPAATPPNRLRLWQEYLWGLYGELDINNQRKNPVCYSDFWWSGNRYGRGSNPPVPPYSTLDPATSYAEYEKTLEIDLGNLLSCINSRSGTFGFSPSDEGGVTLHFSIDGPRSQRTYSYRVNQNNYSVRLRNASDLSLAQDGITLMSDQRIVLWGDYNSDNTNWVPSGIWTDQIYVLTNDWTDAWSNEIYATNRPGADLTVQSGIVTGQVYEGYSANHMISYPFWFGHNEGGGFNFNFVGSIVGLWERQHSSAPYIPPFIRTDDLPTCVNGNWGRRNLWTHGNTLYDFNMFFTRHWSHDRRFNDINNHPPHTPRALIADRPEVFESIHDSLSPEFN